MLDRRRSVQFVFYRYTFHFIRSPPLFLFLNYCKFEKGFVAHFQFVFEMISGVGMGVVVGPKLGEGLG